MDTLESVAVRALFPLAQRVFATMKQLHGERVAGQSPLQVHTALLDDQLRESLGRLLGGDIDDEWWRRVLAEVQMEYVAPDFLKKPALQSWLGVRDVQDAFVSIATARVMDRTEVDQKATRKLLAETYSDQTGEAEHFAEAPIEVVEAILVGGYIASIPRDQRSSAGMIQALDGKVTGVDEKLDRALTQGPLVREMLGKMADDELSEILALRMFDIQTAIGRVRALWERVDNGDLTDAPLSTRDGVRYWAARLHAANANTLPEAYRMRQSLSKPDAGGNPRILDALIKAEEGDAHGAMKLLRDESDGDSHSVLLAILMNYGDEADVLAFCREISPIATPSHFTEAGWRNWAHCLVKAGDWDEVAAGLHALASNQDWSPALAMTEGIVNATLLVPSEQRELALLGNPPTYRGIAPRVGTAARSRHARALECFAHVENLAQEVGESLRQELDLWRTWLGLMDLDPAKAADAQAAVRERLEDGGKGVRLVAFAWAFDITFSEQPLRTYLSSRERLGGLGDEDVVAEFLLNQRAMTSSEFAAYVNERSERLDRIMQNSLTTIMLFHALLEDDQIERAHALLETSRESIDETTLARMEIALEAVRGGDPRNRLEATYRESGQLVDLVNLIAYLKTVKDRAALEPLVLELFKRESTLENAFEVVGLLSLPPTDHGSIVRFLEANPTLSETNDDMRSALAWGLLNTGRVREADNINNVLLQKRMHRNDLSLDANIAVTTGDWERLAAIVHREWPQRAEHDPETLMMLARLASQGGQAAERAVELARLAVEKAPENPHALIAAHGIHVELGRDEQADPSWLPAALEHSSEEGPIWQADLEKVVNDWLPKRREQYEDVERKLLEGTLPMALAAGVLNLPLSRLLLEKPKMESRDGRKRKVIPIISGKRKPVDMKEEWTLGLDVTSTMVLARLGLLEKAIGMMGHVKVAPDAMGCLFAERAAVRFHQPVRVESARQMRKLIDGGRIMLAERTVPPGRDISEEVGRNLAMLLEASRDTDGVVICATPIYKAKSFMEEHANTSAYDDIILSPADLCAVAYRSGRIDGEQYQSAEAFMASQRQQRGDGVSQSILDGPIYLDDLALSHLQSARVLEPIASSGLDLRVHPSVLDEANAFIEAGESGDELAEAVESIRDSLRSAMESDQVSLLPRPPEKSETGLGSLPSVTSIEALIFGSSECDALCVDDRYVNSHVISTSPEGREVPVVCVLDVLRGMHSARVISEVEYWTARHRLREAGFAFVPLEAEELLRHLRGAEFEDGRMLETANLRVIRQTVNRFDSFDLLGADEARQMSQEMALGCVEVLRRLWADASIGVDVAAELSTWIWRYLPATTFLVRKDAPTGESSTPLEELLPSRLCPLLLGPVMGSGERRAAYRQWLEWTVIEPLRSASPELVESATDDVLATIVGIEEHRELFGALFLECLPEGLQKRMELGNPEFVRDCGAGGQILEIENSVKVVESDLIEAAKAVFGGVGIADVSDLENVPVKVFQSEVSETICMSWVNSDGEERQAEFPELMLLCDIPEAREEVISKLVRYLGPTALGTRAILDGAVSRELTAQELSAVLTEKSTGVAAVQSRLARGIMGGWQIELRDLVPLSLAYWEGFCGPVPLQEDPEIYFSEQLIPYRRSLIEADAIGGLDLCCMGALRDDMCPGAWLEAVNTETVLKALASMRSGGNPMALLGVLDIALYRVEDDRFRQIAENTATILLDDRLGFPEGHDGYRYFEILVDFLCNRIAVLEGTAKCPGFWRRMCAWMQAGLIMRNSVACGALPDVEQLEQWCRDNLSSAGSHRRLADCRTEPLVMGHELGFGSLRTEVVSRLEQIKVRHEKAGREVPMATNIKAAVAEAAADVSRLQAGAPGPLGLHVRPVEPLPKEIADIDMESWSALGAVVRLNMLARLSQFFALEERDRSEVAGLVERLSLRAGEIEFREVFAELHAASVVAAATGDIVIADRIGDAISAFAGSDPRPEDVQPMVCTLLQAAAGYQCEKEWFDWLQDRFGELAARLPSVPPNDCVRCLFYHLEWMGMALPARCWPHLRAQRLAAVALEETT